MKKEKWHSLKIEDVLTKLKTSTTGLTEKDVNKRIEKYGKNELPQKKKTSIFQIVWEEITDPIVLLLVVTVIFSFCIGEMIDACAIIFIIAVDLILGTIQEWNAEKNTQALASLIRVHCNVIRNGVGYQIDSSELVIGDIVELESGDKISADLRVIESHNLQIDEAVLTGESVGIQKNSSVLKEETQLAERKNMVYAGTSVITGRATCVVVATAIDTEIGSIATHVANAKETKSPLTIRMEKFSKQITGLIIAIAIIIAIVLYQKGTPGGEIFLSVIALSVSAMPEGLPLALTMALTIGSNRMAKKQVIVKKLNSVESLGSCTVIASDKTGTLTVNEQTAKIILLPNEESFEIEGRGYNGSGKIVPKENANVINAKELSILGVLNNEANLEYKKGEWVSYGDSIDIAFLALGKKADIDTSSYKKVGEIPYESENKYSALFYEKDGKIHCTVKGSIEKVMEFCNTMVGKEKKQLIDKKILNKQNESLAREGYRVIALADGIIDEEEEYQESSIKDLTFQGLVGFIDPVREEVKKSILECKGAGIKVLMITGDHPLTAYKIAEELHLVENENQVATGIEVNEALSKGEKFFDEFVNEKRVFSRVTPMDKLNIVESLKRQGEFVAVTGDGVNDAPAIKSANIGVAMGSGTDVAKETADMIIIDDNFKSIVKGVEEGRCAYSNIRKICYMLLSCGLAEVLFFVLAIIFDLPIPLVAIQLLWLNLVTDGLQDVALSFEKVEKKIMKEPPRNPKESLFNRELLEEILVAGLAIGGLVFIVWYYLINQVHMEEKMARGYIMALMVFMQNIHVFNCRSEKEPFYKVSLRTNLFIPIIIFGSMMLQMIVMEVPFLSNFLQATKVPLGDLITLFLVSMLILPIMEIYKKVKYFKKVNK